MTRFTSTDEGLTDDQYRTLGGRSDGYDELLDRIGDRRFVFIGEASHGTHEFYEERAAITRRLITEKGFEAVAVEADWPDAYRVNRFVQGHSDDVDAEMALGDFKRFPGWMWRNEVVVSFVTWLRGFNNGRSEGAPVVGFYGLDLYSMRTSMEAVISYLDSVDPEAAAAARDRYSCFDTVEEGAEYAESVAWNRMVPCEDEVVSQLIDLRERSAKIVATDGSLVEDEYFFAEQNARLVHNAERYYRTMYHAGVSSWNLRDRHMHQTLTSLIHHFDRFGGRSKVVVWEHNSHVGDARATQLGAAGELTVGQLARTAWGQECFLLGFTTDRGWVTAASNWGGPAERKRVRPALAGSFESMFHLTGVERMLIDLAGPVRGPLRDRRLERAIGVIYRPETELQSHWFLAQIAEQFDAVIHLDATNAVVPLERTELWESGEPPETYPTGL